MVFNNNFVKKIVINDCQPLLLMHKKMLTAYTDVLFINNYITLIDDGLSVTVNPLINHKSVFYTSYMDNCISDY